MAENLAKAGSISRYTDYDYENHAEYNDRYKAYSEGVRRYDPPEELVYGSFGGHKGADCCPLVVNTLTLMALLGGIAAATAALTTFISMALAAGGKKRKKRSQQQIIPEGFLIHSLGDRSYDVIWAGEKVRK